MRLRDFFRPKMTEAEIERRLKVPLIWASAELAEEFRKSREVRYRSDSYGRGPGMMALPEVHREAIKLARRIDDFIIRKASAISGEGWMG